MQNSRTSHSRNTESYIRLKVFDEIEFYEIGINKFDEIGIFEFDRRSGFKQGRM